MRHTG